MANYGTGLNDGEKILTIGKKTANQEIDDDNTKENFHYHENDYDQHTTKSYSMLSFGS